ncbi:MAG: hypothetical protein ACOX61_05160 [Brooklawnia sp.]|jgi:hypothetical protein
MTDQHVHSPDRARSGVSRRSLVVGTAWAVPAVAVASAAPAMAVSLRKDPGINGWVLNSPTYNWNCKYTLQVNSNPRDPGRTPDGAPYGLYIYDVEGPNTFSDIKLVYWIIGDQDASVESLNGHSNCWVYAGRGPLQTKDDGLQYRPYTWNYTCPVTSDQVTTTDRDGVARLYLGNFRVRFSFQQPPNLCNNVTYWTQRFVTIDKDGPSGPLAPEVHTFERRNGTLGTY